MMPSSRKAAVTWLLERGQVYGGSLFNDLLYRSTDQGKTWAQVASPPKAPADQTQTNGARLAASPVNPNVVYLEYAYNDHLTLARVRTAV